MRDKPNKKSTEAASASGASPIANSSLEEFAGMVAVWAGAEALLNIAPSWDQIAARIKAYTLREILDVVGRIAAVLHNSSSHDWSIQLQLCDLLFSPDKAVILRRRLQLMKVRRERDDPSPFSTLVLFAYRSLLIVVQVAVHVCDQESEQFTGGAYDELGEALLIANDLAEDPFISPQGDDVRTDEGLRKWIFYLTTAAAQRGNNASIHIVARAVDLFLSAHCDLDADPDYIDLKALFLEATGLTVEGYTLAFMAFVGVLYGIDIQNVKEREATIPRTFLSGESLQFSDEQIRSFFALIGQDVATFVRLAKKAFPVGVVKPYSYLPFEQSPVISFPSFAVCASLPLLEEKLTSGLYHTLLNAKPGDEHRAFRAQFQRFIGRVFEVYVANSFRRIALVEQTRFRPRFKKGIASVRWVTESEIRAAMRSSGINEDKVCDGILVIGDALLIVEAKAQMFSLAARQGDSIDDFFKRLRAIVIDSSVQLDSVSNAALGGGLRSVGIDPANVRRIFPIVVSLQDLFMNRPLRDWIDGELRAKELFQHEGHNKDILQPMEVIDISDLEWIELFIEQSHESLKGILSQKQGEPMGPFVSLLSWGRVRKGRYIDANARIRHHSARFSALSDGALQYFRKHVKPRSDS